MSLIYDFAMLAIWPIVALYNRQAFVMYFLLVYYTFLFYILDSNFQIYIFSAIAYFLIATSEIKLLSRFRIALFVHGMVYYVYSVDELLYVMGFNSGLDLFRISIITMIDIAIIIILMGGKDEGKFRKLDRRVAYCGHFVLLLLKAVANNTQRGKKA